MASAGGHLRSTVPAHSEAQVPRATKFAENGSFDNLKVNGSQKLFDVLCCWLCMF